MGKPIITESEIIQMTLENVRSFYQRNPDITISPMTDNFMWIGSNDFQWCQSLEEFNLITKKEFNESPVTLSDEEYHLLFHERNVWIVYGRYKATTMLRDGSVIHAHVRGTYVWRRIDGEIKLAHVHGSHAQDIPLNQLLPPPEPLTADTDYFEYMKRMDTVKANEKKLSFRDKDKNHRYLLPSEILYMKSALQWTIVHTITGSFQIIGLLADHEPEMPDTFCRIHKSYLVNSMYIASIRRYKAVLKNGEELPISKERYMNLKRYLGDKKSDAVV